MGSHYTYFAVRGKDEEAILRELDLEKVVDPTATFAGGYYRDPWYLVMDHSWYFLKSHHISDEIKLLSNDCEVVFGMIEERVNFCSCGSLVNGKLNWYVEHNACEYGNDHLVTEGTLPEEFFSIRDRIFKEKEATPEEERWDHYFSIPVDLFDEIVGYNYSSFSGHSYWKSHSELKLKGNQIIDASWFLSQLAEKLGTIGFAPVGGTVRARGEFIYLSKNREVCRLSMGAIGSNDVICNPFVSYQSEKINSFIQANDQIEKEPQHIVAVFFCESLPVMNPDGSPKWIFSADDPVEVANRIENLCLDLKNELVPRFQRYCSGQLTENDIELLKDSFHAEYHLFASFLANANIDKAKEIADWYIENEKLEDYNVEHYKNFVSNSISEFR